MYKNLIVNRNFLLLFIAVIFLVHNINTIANEDVSGVSSGLPRTCQEAIDLVINNIDEDSKQLLLSIKKEELRSRRFITGWGKGIRDGFGLTEGNFELMESCQALREDVAFHPVNISGIIMEEVWSALHQ